MNDIRMEVTDEVGGLRSTVVLQVRADGDPARVAEIAAEALAKIRAQTTVAYEAEK